jgi:four helix bundle protein
VDERELLARTKRFALDVIRFATRLPARTEITVIRNQLLRAGTSVGANYRAACRAQSRPHFISKIAIAEEEADECQYWLELLAELGWEKDAERIRLTGEAGQSVAIFVASKRTARAHEASRASQSKIGNRKSEI